MSVARARASEGRFGGDDDDDGCHDEVERGRAGEGASDEASKPAGRPAGKAGHTDSVQVSAMTDSA